MEYHQISGSLRTPATVGATAAGTAVQVPIIRCVRNIKITGVRFTPGAAMVADNTNFVTLTIRNRGSVDGTGTTTVATRVFNLAGGNGVAAKGETLVLSATEADILAAAGDVVTAQWTHSGTGLAIPASLIELFYRFR